MEIVHKIWKIQNWVILYNIKSNNFDHLNNWHDAKSAVMIAKV